MIFKYKKILSIFLCTVFLIGCSSNHNTDTEDKMDQTVSIEKFEKKGDTFIRKVNYDVETFSFVNKVTVPENYSWYLYSDFEGQNEINTKTIKCSFGDNINYLLVKNEKDTIGFYTVNVYRYHEYNVSFNTSGGAYIEPQKVQEDSLAIRPDDPTKTGYSFASWDFDFSTPIKRDTVITARWNANSYTITFNPNGGEVNPETLVASFESFVTLPTPSRIGYSFVGWFNDNQQISSGKWTYLSDMELVAKWEKSVYTITYNPNGGTVDEGTIQSVVYGDEYALRSAHRTGYEFDGWYDGDSFFSNGVWNFLSNKVLNAHWNANDYIVSFDPNGGSCDTTSLIVTYDSNYEMPIPTRKGYTFAGWYEGDTCYKSGVWHFLSNLDLVARWTVNNYNIHLQAASSLQSFDVIFDFNYNNQSITRTINPGEGFDLPIPKKPNYVFAGWTTTKNSENTRIDLTSIFASATVYALWQSPTKPNMWSTLKQVNYKDDTTITSPYSAVGDCYAIVAPINCTLYVCFEAKSSLSIMSWGTSSDSLKVYSAGQIRTQYFSVETGDVLYFRIGSSSEFSYSFFYSVVPYDSYVFNPEPISINVTYDQPFSLGVPHVPQGKTFVGWYYIESDNQILITDDNGDSLSNYSLSNDIEVLPKFE